MSERQPARAYLSLGSNLSPETNLVSAVYELAAYGEVLRVSRVWETAPVGDINQPNFLNAALLLETGLSAHALRKSAIAAIETKLGRVRDPSNKNAARTIDIDLSLFNRDVLRIGHRKIPDPDILTRAFVAVPLAELDPDYRHPEDGRMLAEIAETLRREVPLIRCREDIVLSPPKS